MEPVFSQFSRLPDRAYSFYETLLQEVSESMPNTECSAGDDVGNCRDDPAALRLKVVAFLFILVAGAAGVTIPLAGKKVRFLRADSSAFTLTKAFAAGIILATGFVHMLPDGQEALTDPCLPRWPWSEFPFPCFVAMAAALGTLILDSLGTQFYEWKQRREVMEVNASAVAAVALDDEERAMRVPLVVAEDESVVLAGDGKGKDTMNILGMCAHAEAHRQVASAGAAPSGHVHWPERGDEDGGPSSRTRHAVVSQILELGIVSHSVIIGLSLGVSRSPCTIRPLVGALAFHQFFEGFALGGCVSQAQFGATAAAVMACFFAVTTPAGIGAGAVLSSFYNPNSPRALAVEGVLDSASAGILIYMALVDLIAADFLSQRMRCNARLQVASYLALFLGALCMSLLAIWA